MRPIYYALIPVLAACGSDEGTTVDGGGDSVCACDAPHYDGDVARELIGTIKLFEERVFYEDDGGIPRETRFASSVGYYVVGRMPRWQREVARAGDCVLLRYTPSLCTPECTDGMCIDTNVCEPFTTFQSAGPLTATGLTVPLTMDGPEGYYYGPQLPDELFADDATVTATLAGAAYPAHVITSGGVPMLEPDIITKITLVPGQDHTLRWTPAAADTRVHVTLNANNHTHGAPYRGIIECDVPDSAGEVTIAAALVDGFPPTQAWTICVGVDCPPSTIRRYHRGTTALGAGEAELIVGSQFNFGVDHMP